MRVWRGGYVCLWFLLASIRLAMTRIQDEKWRNHVKSFSSSHKGSGFRNLSRRRGFRVDFESLLYLQDFIDTSTDSSLTVPHEYAREKYSEDWERAADWRFVWCWCEEGIRMAMKGRGKEPGSERERVRMQDGVKRGARKSWQGRAGQGGRAMVRLVRGSEKVRIYVT